MDNISNNRFIALDTETTGLEVSDGHRIIEVGAVEIINRQITTSEYQQYTQPERKVADSIRIHGISDEFLQDKPLFNQTATKLIEYISGATLLIHNAAFDIGFLNYEFSLMGIETRIEDICEVIDTIDISKSINPRAQHNLDALARRYHIDLSERALHGALLDSQILAQVYLTMTGGQRQLFDGNSQELVMDVIQNTPTTHTHIKQPVIIMASKKEEKQHQNYLKKIS